MTLDDPATLDRQAEYLDAVRALGRRPRALGYIACLVGVLMVAIARFRLGGESWLLWSGVAVIAAGWALFVYAVAARLKYVRAHPFDRNR